MFTLTEIRDTSSRAWHVDPDNTQWLTEDAAAWCDDHGLIVDETPNGHVVDTSRAVNIDGEIVHVGDVFDGGYLPLLETDGREEYHVAEDSEAAGAAAAAYWRDMAENDPAEFACIVGEDTLIAWALGQWAGPGSAQVRSLAEWLEVVADHPAEEFAGYDHTEREIAEVSEELAEEIGFVPTVAYRHN